MHFCSSSDVTTEKKNQSVSQEVFVGFTLNLPVAGKKHHKFLVRIHVTEHGAGVVHVE